MLSLLGFKNRQFRDSLQRVCGWNSLVSVWRRVDRYDGFEIGPGAPAGVSGDAPCGRGLLTPVTWADLFLFAADVAGAFWNRVRRDHGCRGGWPDGGFLAGSRKQRRSR